MTNQTLIISQLKFTFIFTYIFLWKGYYFMKSYISVSGAIQYLRSASIEGRSMPTCGKALTLFRGGGDANLHHPL